MFKNFGPARDLLAGAKTLLEDIRGKRSMAATRVRLAKAISEAEKLSIHDEGQLRAIEAAKRENRDIEFDDCPAVLKSGRGGYLVAAWVYVEVGAEEEGEEEGVLEDA